jgi:hypothetical protein
LREERLARRHAEALAELERAYPQPMRAGVDRLREKLGWLEQSRFSFSWILFEDELPTAYMVAYPSTSQVDVPDPETVVKVDDLIVDQGRAHDFYRLLSLLVADLEERRLGHLPIEATCRRTAYEVATGHPRVIARLGYELQAQYEYWEGQVGEELCWLRFVPLPTATVATVDSLSYSEDLREELAWSRNIWNRSTL